MAHEYHAAWLGRILPQRQGHIDWLHWGAIRVERIVGGILPTRMEGNRPGLGHRVIGGAINRMFDAVTTSDEIGAHPIAPGELGQGVIGLDGDVILLGLGELGIPGR